MNIIIAGDYCPQYRVANCLNCGDYESVFDHVRPLVEQADYSIVNLECPVSDAGMIPIKKCGPNLKCTEKGIDALKWVGFKCVTLANNHFLDYGSEGVSKTILSCKNKGIDIVGGGRNIKEASEILIKKIDGITIAFINCCEHEFSQSTETTSGSNPLNPIQQYKSIQRAKEQADYVVVIVHGGHEHYQLPSPRMKEMYRFFVDVGADVVVNHHQHCFSGYEIYKEKPIFYGLGNFCFDWIGKRNGMWNEGLLLSLKLERNHKIQFVLIPYRQCEDNPSVKILKDSQVDMVLKKLSELNAIIANSTKLQEEFSHFCESRENDLLISLMPYRSRLLKALGYRRLIPTFVSRNKALQLYNYVVCESHRDTLLHYLNKLYERKN
jgi:hypothetical protein